MLIIMPLLETATPQPGFPRADVEIDGGLIDILCNPLALDEAHALAENVNALYAVGHSSIDATIRRLNTDDQTKTAFTVGIKAFEALGAYLTPPLQLDKYSAKLTSTTMSAKQDAEGFNMDFVLNLESLHADLSYKMPVLTEAIRKISTGNLDAIGPEILRRAIMGAATIRSLQLDVEAQMHSAHTKAD